MRTWESIADAGPSSPWLVLLHGFSQDRRAFSGQLDAFRVNYRLLLVDLPGHGAAAAARGPYGHAELSVAVRGAIDAAIGPEESCSLWGTHTGAAIALLLASRERKRYASLVLEGAVLPGRPMQSVAATYARMQTLARIDGVDAAKRAWFDEAAWFAVMRERPVACRAEAHRAMIADFGGRPWLEPGAPAPVSVDDKALAAIDLPVLLINGEHDLADFIAAADHLQRLLPQAARCTVAGGGGFPGWEFPAVVNARVHAFLARIETAT